MLEPFHACTPACRFRGRICIATRKPHVCTQRCVLLDSESNYVCTVTGLNFAGSATLHVCTPACIVVDSARRGVCAVTGIVDTSTPPAEKPAARRLHVAQTRRVRGWIAAAILLFLTRTEARAATAEAFTARASARIRRSMPPAWSARALIASAQCAQRWLDASHPLVGALGPALIEYYDRFAKAVFKPTRPGITTFVAVMINALATGIADATNVAIVQKHPLLAVCAPPLIDYPKLSARIVSCKAMSTGEYAIRNRAVSGAGGAYANAVFRL
jgi:hypothetical protein